MKKILSTIAIACLSFSCFAESYFVKIADNEYVLQHGKTMKANKKNISEAVYTPTHIFTYPDGNPSHFRNIQKIDYTKSGVTFAKDMRSRKCCIDILDNRTNENKCRIIGVNGRSISDPISVGGNTEQFEVYEAAETTKSFSDNEPRLIFINHTGLYIVSKKENPIETATHNYFKTGNFNFKGEVIEISAIDGKCKATKCLFSWPSETAVIFAPVSHLEVKFIPIMEQIREIIGIIPESAPPTFEIAKGRVAEMLNIPEEMLVIEDEIIKIIGLSGIVISSNAESRAYSNYKNILNPLKSFFPVARISMGNKWIETMQKEVYKNYKFDTSPAAQKRRREIALKPWDEE